MRDIFKKLFEIGKKVSEVAEEIQSSRSTSSESATSAADAASGQQPLNTERSALHQRHLDNRFRDPETLINAADAELLFGQPFEEPSTTADEEYFSVYLRGMDDPDVRFTLGVAAGMPWDYITDEAADGQPTRELNAEAVTGHGALYVRKNGVIFWINPDGIDEEAMYRIAEFVISRIEG